MIPASLQRTFAEKSSYHTMVSGKQGGLCHTQKKIISSTETVVSHIQNAASHWVISTIKPRAVVNNKNTRSKEPLSQLTPINHKVLFTMNILSKAEYGISLAITQEISLRAASRNRKWLFKIINTNLKIHSLQWDEIYPANKPFFIF